MQKSSLKLNNIFVTVLRGTDCLEPCWSLDLEYFGVVLTVKSVKITSEHPRGRFHGGGFQHKVAGAYLPLVASFGTGSFSLPLLNRAVLPAPGRGTGGWIRPHGLQTGRHGRHRQMLSEVVPAWLHARHRSAPLSPPYLYRFLALQSGSCPSLGENVPSHLLGSGRCLLLSNVQRTSRVSWRLG